MAGSTTNISLRMDYNLKAQDLSLIHIYGNYFYYNGTGLLRQGHM